MSIGLVRLFFCQSVNDFQKFIRRGGYTHFEIAGKPRNIKIRRHAKP